MKAPDHDSRRFGEYAGPFQGKKGATPFPFKIVPAMPQIACDHIRTAASNINNQIDMGFLDEIHLGIPRQVHDAGHGLSTVDKKPGNARCLPWPFGGVAITRSVSGSRRPSGPLA